MENEDQTKYDQHNNKAFRIILLGISDYVQPHVRECTKAKDEWKKLHQVYESKNLNQIMHLQGQLHTLRLKGGETLESFLCRISEL